MANKKKHQRFIKSLLGIFVFIFSFAWGTFTFRDTSYSIQPVPSQVSQEQKEFPIGVNPEKKEIVENSEVENFYQTYVYVESEQLNKRSNWFARTARKIALMPWYQSLAALPSRTLVIYAGERKEEVAENFAQILKWNSDEQALFQKIIEEDSPSIREGKFYPGYYVVSKNASPTEVAELVYKKFYNEIASYYSASLDRVVPFQQALTLASLLEREAYDFTDMRYISGVIWNRLFVDMRLQIDATLQYARANTYGGKWWPQPRPRDKDIDSPYNTYIHAGLPPHPISNPSSEAILAALNPFKTDCMYYFHDKDAGFHCSKTYEEHQALIEEYY